MAHSFDTDPDTELQAIREALELNGLETISQIPGYPDETMIGLFLESTRNLTKEYGADYVRTYRETFLRELEYIASL
ncbi:MAG: hypothetical protein P4N41_00780 [Negativicutes bacterium]|nr:hypothetical protein [Negativicutes bacterium]